MANKALSGQDYINYYGNHFLASKEGKEITSRIATDHPDLQKTLDKVLDNHTKALGQMQGPPVQSPQAASVPLQQLALGDDKVPGTDPLAPNSLPITSRIGQLAPASQVQRTGIRNVPSLKDLLS